MWSEFIYFEKCWCNLFILSLSNNTTHSHAYFHVFLLILWYVTSTSEMALISSVNPGHGTDACLHNTWNDICVQMTQVYHFTILASVEASAPLKVLNINQRTLFTVSFIQLKQWTVFTMNDIEFYWMWTLPSFIYCELYMNLDSWMTIELMWRTVVNDTIGTLIKQFKVWICIQ